MSSTPSHADTFQSSGRGSRHINATSVASTKSDRASAYSNSFPQILEDSGIYMKADPSMLADREELGRETSVRRSLAPSECSGW
ncbi:hypothetical protein GJ744_001492 [Endocarpon pusillum]|uniref:Uncharacterized protein n=1 Tax=Endocarpon pusillum TaxID=364733 RepID=A0A8H7A9K6_9EURO|nr:hypothetical protein GJ744_001492 [Endocarpon pusillum]